MRKNAEYSDSIYRSCVVGIIVCVGSTLSVIFLTWYSFLHVTYNEKNILTRSLGIFFYFYPLIMF